MQAATLLTGVIILQRVFVCGEEVAHVAVARGVFLVFVTRSIECVERHGNLLRAESWDNNAAR